MTDEEIKAAKESFISMGVAEDAIFAEIMRAHYLDYNLFLNPSNAEYGVTIEDLHKNMKLTVDVFGDYDGDAETYANVYTLALRINPMDFAEDVSRAGSDLRGLTEYIIRESGNFGKTILLAGAEHYLYMLPKIFYDLKDCRIAVAVNSEVWKKNLSYLFPRGRIMLSEEILDDEETYDYIFSLEEESLKKLPPLKACLSERGKMDAATPYSFITNDVAMEIEIRRKLAEEKSLIGYYDFSFNEEEFVLLEIKKENSETVSFGEAVVDNGILQKTEILSLSAAQFFEADDWNYDIYAYNSSMALQTILRANVVNMENTISKEFSVPEKEKISLGRILGISKNAILEDIGLRADLSEEINVTDSIVGTKVKAGDLLLASDRNRVYTAVAEQGQFVADDSILVIRPLGMYTAEYLKIYLDGPVGKLFLETLRAGDHFNRKQSRFLRIPFPQADEERITQVTELCRISVERLSLAAAKWREAKRKSVQIMMGK